MGDKSAIEWTDATWNPIVGCSVVSPGCTNCYAMKMAARLEHMHQPQYAGLTRPSKAGAVWTGKLRLVETALDLPLRRRVPTTYFVNSMSDLFHESVPDEWIDRVFAVMALCPQHTFQCLTKRSARMRAYCNDPSITQRIAQAMDAIRVDMEHDPTERWAPVPGWEAYEVSTHGNLRRGGEPIQPVLNPLYGRPSVTLWRENEPTTVYVHKLVLAAHRGAAPSGTEARHRNGNRQDNRLANLEWATGSINQADKVRHGANGGPAKITREQAAEIRARRKRGSATQQQIADEYGISRSLVSLIESRKVWPDAIEWPLPNVWLGVSCEDQARADARIPDLLATPAAVRFVSAEPMVGPINFFDIRVGPQRKLDSLRAGVAWERDALGWALDEGAHPALDWLIVGGESGPGARPFALDWAESIIDQCRAAGVACFMKQVGSKPARIVAQGLAMLRPMGSKGGDPAEWPSDLRVRDMPAIARRLSAEADAAPQAGRVM